MNNIYNKKIGEKEEMFITTKPKIMNLGCGVSVAIPNKEYYTTYEPIKSEHLNKMLDELKNNKYTKEQIADIMAETFWLYERLIEINVNITAELNHFKDINNETRKSDAVRNRRRSLKQLNKAIKRKNQRITELEAQLKLSKESEKRVNDMFICRASTAAQMFGSIIAFLPDKED